MNQDKRRQAAEAHSFLRNHPALNSECGGDPIDSLCVVPCCKNGRSDGHSVTVYPGTKLWKKFGHRWEPDYDGQKLRAWDSIQVPYKDVFGQEWAFHHVEYWIDACFFVFTGNPYVFSDQFEPKNWSAHSGIEHGARSFEALMIKTAKKAKDIFGDFQLYSDELETPEERENHRLSNPFANSIDLGNGMHQCVFNHKYVDVSIGLQNLRWLKWFKETDYCKKNWLTNLPEFDTLVSKIETLMPEERKKILCIP